MKTGAPTWESLSPVVVSTQGFTSITTVLNISDIARDALAECASKLAQEERTIDSLLRIERDFDFAYYSASSRRTVARIASWSRGGQTASMEVRT